MPNWRQEVEFNNNNYQDEHGLHKSGIVYQPDCAKLGSLFHRSSFQMPPTKWNINVAPVDVGGGKIDQGQTAQEDQGWSWRQLLGCH